MYPDSIKNLIESFKYLPGIGEKTAERLAFSVLELEGYEADDILGTLAKYGEDNGIEVLLLTGDRDALQLIDKNTCVIAVVNYCDKENSLQITLDKDWKFSNPAQSNITLKSGGMCLINIEKI